VFCSGPALVFPAVKVGTCPGTFSAVFRASLRPNQTPLPHFAFALPLLKHAPSVYTVILLCLRSGPSGRCRRAGWSASLVWSMKIQKQSARLSLQVIVGSKMISSFFVLAWMFWVFLLLVRDRVPCGGRGAGVRVCTEVLPVVGAVRASAVC